MSAVKWLFWVLMLSNYLSYYSDKILSFWYNPVHFSFFLFCFVLFFQNKGVVTQLYQKQHFEMIE